MNRWRLPRRTFLRGMGYSLLLPALDVMTASRANAEVIPPPRFISFFLSLGTYGRGYDPTKNGMARYPRMPPYNSGGMGVWQPPTVGPLTALLGPALAPLESVKDKISILSGLATLAEDPPGSGINHSAATTAWATSAWRSGAAARAANISGGQHTPQNRTPPDSLDQYIANAIGLTPGSTLVMSPSGSADFSELGQGGHGGAISYNSKLAPTGSTLLPRNNNPKRAFDTLFGNCLPTAAPRVGYKSILDYVAASIPKVQQKLGSGDRARLDSYLQNVRDLEARLDAIHPCPAEPVRSPPLNGGPLDAVSNLNLMVDVIALAVSSGVMPIASLMTAIESSSIAGGSAAAAVDYLSTYVGVDGSRVRYHAPTLDTHFDVTHAQSNSTAGLRAIEEHIAYTQLGVTFLQRLIEKLDQMPLEPNGFSPLDNTIILAGAAHSDPYSHNTHNLPTLVAGGGRYRMTQGQHIAFPMLTDIGDLYYTIASAVGAAGASFNGRNTVLPGLFQS
jgi:hypothetical protein